ncbi:MAG: energy transducer TonB [Bacteroidota bacterium]
MIYNHRSKKTAVLKYGLFLPLFALIVVVSSAMISTNKNVPQLKIGIRLNEPLNLVNDAVDFSDLLNYLRKSVRYPPIASSAQIQGISMVRFTVKNGEASDVGIASSALGYGCDTELMSKLLTYTNFKSIPDGKYALKVNFTLSGATSSMKNNNLKTPENHVLLPEVIIRGYLPKKMGAPGNDISDDRIYDFVSLNAQPSFPGGMEKLYSFLKNNVVYPLEAKTNKIQGTVFLSFIVEKDGSLTGVKAERRLGYGTDEEAVRVLEASPKWVPGVQQGKKVRVKYNIPIRFSLTK